ncbi:MAG: hypothetical protein KDA57_14285 [Planctomycetales bacterium]|nr:hypothetical protein [Planctomycetales bacterium]
MRLHYSTVTDNSSGTLEDAPGSGGGIFLATGKLEVVHSIIAENEDPTGVGTDLTGYLGSVLDVRHSLIGTNLGTGLTPAPVGSPDANGNLIGGSTASKRINPLLGPLADNGGPTKTHALLPGSPAIDAGDPSLVQGMRGVPEFDQRGAPYGRVAGRIDIGAFEVQPPGGMLRGDFDGDADTDGFDFLAWQRGFGRIGGALRPDGDGTDDGDVDNNDEAVWEATFGTHPLPLPPVVQRYRIASSPTSVAREQLIDAAIAVATLPDRLQTVRSAAPLNIAELSAELARHVEVSNERWIRVDARRNSEDPWGRRAERTPPVDAADGGFEQLAPEMLDEGFSQF